jgi:hypothetical protein
MEFYKRPSQSKFQFRTIQRFDRSIDQLIQWLIDWLSSLVHENPKKLDLLKASTVWINNGLWSFPTGRYCFGLELYLENLPDAFEMEAVVLCILSGLELEKRNPLPAAGRMTATSDKVAVPMAELLFRAAAAMDEDCLKNTELNEIK